MRFGDVVAPFDVHRGSMDDDFTALPRTQHGLCHAAKTKGTLGTPFRVRICPALQDHYSSRVRGAFDVRVWNEQGTTTVGKGLFRVIPTVHGTGSSKVKKKKLHVREIGVRAASPEVEHLIETIGARIACRRDVLFSRTRSIKDSPFWLNAVKQGAAKLSYSQGRDDLFNLYVAKDACALGRRELKRNPNIMGRYFDPGPDAGAFSMTDMQRKRARCKEVGDPRGTSVRLCRKKSYYPRDSVEYDWSGFDVTVKRRGQVMGEGLFTEYAWSIHTEGVRAQDNDTQLDIELLAARLACGMGKEYISARDPESSYFWRTKQLEGSTRRFPGQRRLMIEPEEACRGIPLYTKKGVLERVKRRPKIY